MFQKTITGEIIHSPLEKDVLEPRGINIAILPDLSDYTPQYRVEVIKFLLKEYCPQFDTLWERYSDMLLSFFREAQELAEWEYAKLKCIDEDDDTEDC